MSPDENVFVDPALTDTLQFAHILFMDVIGYAKLPSERQGVIVQELQRLVQGTADFRAATEKNEILCLPRGDGMALVFFRDALYPVRCAQDIARELKSRQYIQLRMGVHSGPVFVTQDINGDADVSGAGIVTAQRVMDCGDSGHILMSSAVAEQLLTLSAWIPYLHDMGSCAVKHGHRVHLFNFYSNDVGNRNHPRKLMIASAAVVAAERKPRPAKAATRVQSVKDSLMIVTWTTVAIAGLFCGALVISPTLRDIIATSFSMPSIQARAKEDGKTDRPGTGTPLSVDEEKSAAGAGGGPIGYGKGRGTSPSKVKEPEGKPGGQDPPPPVEKKPMAPSIWATLVGSDAHLASAPTPSGEQDEGANGQTEPSLIVLHVEIPTDGAGHRKVRFTKADARGSDSERTGADTEGQELKWPDIEAYGKLVTFRVYYNDDNEPVLTQSFKLPDK